MRTCFLRPNIICSITTSELPDGRACFRRRCQSQILAASARRSRRAQLCRDVAWQAGREARPRRSPAEGRAAILAWRDAFPLIETSASIMLAATDLAIDHRLGIWDAVILAAAAAAGCRLLLSEDLQDGFTWNGVTVTNPFAPSR